MPRALLFLLAALLAIAAACGDDDDGNGTATPSAGAATETETAPATENGNGEAPTADDDKTPDPDDTPETTSPAATGPGDPPTAPPPAPGGTPAVRPEDQSAFLAQFDGLPIDQSDCAYNPATALTNCGQFGLYSIDPPIAGQDAQCSILIVSEVPRIVQCRTAEPSQTINYEIIQ
jgi:hypothetical protein